MSENYDRIGIIGDPDSVLAFKAIGVEAYPTTDSFEAKELIKEMAKKNFKVIFVTEKLAKELEEFLDRYKAKSYPAIVPVPTATENIGYGMQGIKNDMEKAIGADILFRKD